MQEFNRTDVDIIDRTAIRKGFLSLFRYRLKHKLFAGGWSAVMDREVMDRGHAVVVIPYDPERDELILLEQFRAGALDDSELTGNSPWLLEFVAGMMDKPNENPEDVAHRELLEESGLRAKSLHYALTYLSSPGGCTEKITIFIAEVDSQAAASHAGVPTEHEDIRVHVLPRQQVMELLATEAINNAASVIGLQWLELHREKWLSPTS